MFGFIKNLFSGIIAFVGGLFGSKKKGNPELSAPKVKKGGGYFMELEEAAEDLASTVGQKISGKSASETEKKPEPAKAQAADASAKKPEPAKAQSASATEKKPEITPAQATKAQAAKIELVQDADSIKAVPRTTAPSAVSNGQGSSQTDVTFAPKFLNPITSTNSSSRRRPGPSLDYFKGIARQVKTPNS
jgi:hypothetical protein